MPYFKVYWVATVGESIVKADSEEEAMNIAGSGSDDKIISEEFWWHDAEPCVDEARKLDDDELKAYDIS